MKDFIFAALPWIACGILLAVFFKKKNVSDTEETYIAEGMSMGMCIGVALDSSIGKFTGIGMILGMLLGMVVGSLKRKE